MSRKRRRPPSVRVRATQQLRRSGAAGIHGDRRTRRSRTRGAARRHAIQEARE